jgi:hypothetical protein
VARTRYGSRIIDLPPDDSLQGTWKLEQPHGWLTITDDGPYISKPGGVGSTSQKFSKFFRLDSGTYELTYARLHGRELIMHGAKLKGRLLIQYVPVAGRRIWLANRPIDQTPYTQTHKLEDVIRELHGKNQEYLLWAQEPGDRAQLINIKERQARVNKSIPGRGREIHAAIFKRDSEKRLVSGVVLEPDKTDHQGDEMTADDIESTAHRFLIQSRVIGDNHSKPAEAELVESYLAPVDFELNGEAVIAGSWVIVVHVLSDILWQDILDGRYTGFSVGGFGDREPVIISDPKQADALVSG